MGICCRSLEEQNENVVTISETLEYTINQCCIYINIRVYRCIGRSQWPRGVGRGSTAARLLGLRVRIPPGMDVCLL